MPGFLLHQGATILCAHAGQATPMVTDLRVKVGGQPIVVQSNTYSIAGCPFAPGGVPTPCVTGTWISAAVRVKASGQPVLLQDSQSTCVPNGTPMTIVATQVRVQGT